MPDTTIKFDLDFAEHVKSRLPYEKLLADNGCCHDSIGYDAHPDALGMSVTVHAGCDRCRASVAARVELSVDGDWFTVIGHTTVWLCSHGVHNYGRNADLPCLKFGNVTAMKDGRPVRVCVEHSLEYA